MIGRCEYAAGLLLALLVPLAGCGGSNSGTPEGTLIVRERLLPGASLPVEGWLSFATLKPASGGQPVARERPGLGPGSNRILFEQRLDPGEYRLSSWIRTCGGNCGILGPPRDRCETELKVRGDERRVAMITRSNEGPCEIKLNPPGA
jgi:hypothetical protein